MLNKTFFKLAAATLALAAPVGIAAFPAHADARSESNDAYVQGFRLFQAGDYRSARIQLMKALKANPNNGLARLLQARVALEFGSGIQAQTELERAMQAGIPSAKVRHLRAHALMMQRKYGEAMDLLDARTIEPQFAAYAARLRGQILTQQRNMPEARAEFERARRIAPKDPETLVDVARFYASDGKLQEASALADQVLAAKPTNVKGLMLKGDLVRRSQGLEPSLTYFNRALEVDPNNIEALLERAATLGDLKREDQARADLKRINGLVPDHPLALYLEAVLETRAGQYEKARQLMTRTKGTLSSYVPALMLQGMLAYQANDTAQATDFFGKVVGASPNAVLPRKLYAASQLKGNDTRGAIETLKPVIDSGAADGRTYALYGAAFAREGKMAEAQQYLQKAVTEAPKAGELKTQLAMTQLLQGNAESAEEGLMDVLKDDSKSLQALMVLTLIQIRDREFDKALVTSNRIITLYPNLPVGYNIRGGAELGLGQTKKAEASFRTALEKKSDYTEARRNLAQVLIATNRIPEGERELKQLLEYNKRDGRALTLLAVTAARRGDATARVEWLRQAAAVDAKQLGPRVQLADAYLDTNQNKRALDEVASILRDFPEQPQALLAAARVYEAAGQKNQVESVLNRLVNAQPDSPQPRVMLARAQEANKKAAAARATYQRILTMPRVDPTPVYSELVFFEARQGDWNAAKQWAERLRKQAPKENFADLALGRAYLGRNQAAAALPYLEAARKTKFNLAAARALSQAYVQTGKPAQAVTMMQAYQKANPRDPIALAAIAELQMQQRQYKAAIANYEALRKLPNAEQSVTVLNNLAWAYSLVGDKRALATGKQAYAVGPNVPAVQDTYGWLLLRNKGDRKLALSLLQKAVAGTPNDPDVRFHLAVGYAMNGQRSKAVEALETALKAPKFDSRPAAQKLLTSLQGS